MATLCVNIDHVATLRQARGGIEPDPVHAAMEAELGGSTGVTIHLREDRRHIQDRDLRLVREIVKGHLNLEMASTDEMVRIARSVKADMATIVPERRQEVTTEGGLDVIGGGARLRKAIATLKKAGILVSLFISTDPRQIEASAKAGADEIEMHTGPYAHARGAKKIARELDLLNRGSELAQSLGMIVNAGHGLNYQNVRPVAAIAGMRELNIGHAIVSRAVFDGMRKAVADMDAIIRASSR